jgi:hypothetical protein
MSARVTVSALDCPESPISPIHTPLASYIQATQHTHTPRQPTIPTPPHTHTHTHTHTQPLPETTHPSALPLRRAGSSSGGGRGRPSPWAPGCCGRGGCYICDDERRGGGSVLWFGLVWFGFISVVWGSHTHTHATHTHIHNTHTHTRHTHTHTRARAHARTHARTHTRTWSSCGRSWNEAGS